MITISHEVDNGVDLGILSALFGSKNKTTEDTITKIWRHSFDPLTFAITKYLIKTTKSMQIVICVVSATQWNRAGIFRPDKSLFKKVWQQFIRPTLFQRSIEN